MDGKLRKDGERRETGTKRCPTKYEIHRPRPLALQDATKRVLIGRVSGPIFAVWITLLSVRCVKRLKT
jgi:hypothetical protein